MSVRNKWLKHPFETQEKIFRHLILKSRNTKFGKDHDFASIKTYSDFKRQVPIRDYEALRDYIDLVVKGEENILWPDKPRYLSKTSGTTSGAKYIPITKQSMPYHIRSAKHALLSYVDETKKADFVDGKMIFLQGSPKLDQKSGIACGRLSGIVAHHVPAYLQKNRMPSLETNLIEDWETKVDKIVEETLKEDMRLISGIPSWVQMYFEKLIQASGKNSIKDIFPNFSLFVHGGVNYEPYRAKFEEMIGERIPNLELYPASEGFIAYQDSQEEEGMLLEINSGIFYEFIPMSEFDKPNPSRLGLKDIELNVNYAIILNSNAGLWGYLIGDTVKFVSKFPFRIKVSGRIKHYTSAFGEHVIAEEVENAMKLACEKMDCAISEFHVAPQTSPSEGLPFHEWFVEFGHKPTRMEAFSDIIDAEMQNQNPYYKDLIEGNVLRKLVLSTVNPGGFTECMKEKGKLGGQNKIPRLSNQREFADTLTKFLAQ